MKIANTNSEFGLTEQTLIVSLAYIEGKLYQKHPYAYSCIVEYGELFLV